MGTVRCCLLKPSALSHVDCAPGAGADDDDDDVFYLFLQKQKIGAELQAPYIPWTASPTYADFGGLSWLVSLVIVRKKYFTDVFSRDDIIYTENVSKIQTSCVACRGPPRKKLRNLDKRI
jgi:hypothetical protein